LTDGGVGCDIEKGETMDKLVRKIEFPMAKRAIEQAGLYIVQRKDLDRLAEVAADAYRDYPLHNWLTKGKYDATASKLIMQITLKAMTKDAIIYADSEALNGFAVWLPFGFSGSKTLPFLMNGGLRLILHSGPGIIGRLLAYENYAMELKKKFTDHYDWYLYNLSIKKEAQGKGIASKLMRPMLHFCDEEMMVAYLETNKEANVGLYRHYGFELMREELIPKTTVTHYAMVRHPKGDSEL
jgi:ribosomal protein S18 acetylase RimI-like enzyme